MASANPIRFYAAMVAFGLFNATNALGQASGSQPSQTLDQVDAFTTKAVLDMAFDDPSVPADYADLGIPGNHLAACKLATQGLFCLEVDGQGNQVVRQWRDTQQPLQFVDLLRCDDPGLGLSGGPVSCTGLTVDLSGAVWLAGPKTGTTYSLVKVRSKALLTSCPGSGDWTVLSSNPALCAREFATGNGVLADLDAIDGEVAAAFGSFGTGVLAIENGTLVTYFNLDVPGAPPIGFGSWGLASGSRLQSTALLQVSGANPADPVANFLLATTSQGQVLSKPAASPATVSPATVSPATVSPVFSLPSPPITIDATTWGACLTPSGQTSCAAIAGVTLAANGGTGLIQKSLVGTPGLGIAGGAAAGEIDAGESLVVTFPEPRMVAEIQLLFLFNGPEYGDKSEVAQVTTDQGTFTLSVRNDQDDATADWTGTGAVSKCGATTSSGSGCFLITNPFPAPVSSLTFTTVSANPPFSGSGNNNSDYSIGRVTTANSYAIRTSAKSGRAYVSNQYPGAVQALEPNGPAFTALQPVKINNGADDLTLSTAPFQPDGLTVAPGIDVNLADCTDNCPLLKDETGAVTAAFENVKLAPGPSGVTLYQVKGIPDCRYVPQVCRNLLMGSNAASDDAARQDLINAGWILPLDTANRLKPAAELLNVTPLLPEDVTSLFDTSGVAPNGLPPLYISNPYRGQGGNQYRFEAFFFKSADGLVFLDTFGGEFDVAGLAGTELGCIPVPGNLLAWDVSTSVNETYRSVGGRYVDSITNVGCGTTRIVAKRLSLLPYNLEIAPDTFGPTIRSKTPVVTVNNDAVFARLVQGLWTDVGSLRTNYACKQADPVPAGGPPPLTSADCKKLADIWSTARFKLDLCVGYAFGPKNYFGTALCQAARKYVTDYAAALPAAATGPDVANRLGEQKANAAVFLHVFDTRFLPSIKAGGFCREKNISSCPP